MNFFAFSALVNALTTVPLGFYVIFKGRRNPLNQSYFFLAFSVFLWNFGYFFWQLSTAPEKALFWCRLLMAGAALIPIADFNFVLWLTRKYHQKRWESYLSYLVGALFVVLSFTSLMVRGVEKKLFFELWPQPGPAYLLFLAMFFFYAVYSLDIIYSVYRGASGRVKSQLRYVFIGTLVGYAGGSANYFLWYDIPVVPVTTILVTVFPLLLAYAITKHRLMDISIIISRAVAEFLTAVFLGVIYLSLVWFQIKFIAPAISKEFLAWTVIYGILVGQIYTRIRLRIQTTADKVFLKGKYDYYKTLAETSLQVGEQLSLAAILKIIYRTFSEVVEISNPRVFLPLNFSDPEKPADRYVVCDRQTLILQLDGESIEFSDPVIRELIRKRRPIYHPRDRKREMIVPCLLENRLIAIFVLGGKLSEDPYTSEDIRLLEVLASQAAIALDHTRSYEKIKVDLEVAERQLARSQRLASLGTLTAGVTHEIRNPLTVIRSETDRLAKKERSLKELREYRDLVLRHVDRIAGIVQRMLSMAKGKPKREAEVDLNVVFNSALQLVNLDNVSLKKELGEIPPIKGDPVGIEEVFVNLIQNAVQAMPGGGSITLRTYKDEGRIVAEVSDTGRGIPDEIREKIFDPFFSGRHEGVGLGLSIAYRIIREHGGDVEVNSQAGKGTTFKVMF